MFALASISLKKKKFLLGFFSFKGESTVPSERHPDGLASSSPAPQASIRSWLSAPRNWCTEYTALPLDIARGLNLKLQRTTPNPIHF